MTFSFQEAALHLEVGEVHQWCYHLLSVMTEPWALNLCNNYYHYNKDFYPR